MQITFKSPAVLVTDMARSKTFYTEILNQEIEMDNGEHIAFKGGFSIWDGKHAYSLIYNDGRKFPASAMNETYELYFETDALEKTWENVHKKGVSVLHPIHEHPWGQRGFRILDPDGRILEIAEPLSLMIRRFREEGMDDEQIKNKTSIPAPLIKILAG